jgi:BarA-like signal transduction histidine kinase
MLPDAPYFIILLCLTPDHFTRQVESAATQWVNWLRIKCMLYIQHNLLLGIPSVDKLQKKEMKQGGRLRTN